MIRRCATWVGSARILDERQCFPVPDARRTGHDQSPIDEHGVLVVDSSDTTVSIGERDGEGDARLLVPRAVDEADRGGVGAVSAIHAGDPPASDHELIDVRLIPERRSPSAPPVIGVECCRRLCE